MKTQKDWRQMKRQERKNLSYKDRIQNSQMIVEQVLATKAYQQVSCLGAYLAMPEEVDVRALIEQAWDDGKLVYLPVVLGWGRALQFAPYQPESVLTKDSLGMMIPSCEVTDYITAASLDVVITPLVAFDQQCNRIGMGGGFYDRTFEKKSDSKQQTTLIGVAFDTQCVDGEIVTNTWDVNPDMIITEKRIYQP